MSSSGLPGGDVDVGRAMAHFRRAWRDTFNNFFLVDEREQLAEAYVYVEAALFRTLVLDCVDSQAAGLKVFFKGNSAGSVAAVQGIDAGDFILSDETRVLFEKFMDSDFYDLRDGEFVLGRVVSAPMDELVGMMVMARYSDIEFVLDKMPEGR